MAAPLLYICRHGETDWNVEYRLQGQADTDINARGRAQAIANGLKLKALIPDPADFAFVASPLRRTRQTMELIRETMGLAPDGYSIEPRLMELNFGDWQGYTYAELEARRPGTTQGRRRDKWNFRPPGEAAESYAMLTERVGAWLAGVTEDTVAVVHGGVIRALFRLHGMPEAEAASLDVPQDRVLRSEGGTLAWI